MTEIQRQVPTATGVERRTLVAAALSVGLGGLFGVYLGGLFGSLLSAAAGAGGFLVVALGARSAARRSSRRLQAFADELGEELEVHRREETRLRAVARSMAAENEESERRRRAAETSERTKSAFIKTLSQELRTPLANVHGMSGLLLEAEQDESQRDYARTIHGAAEALIAIVDDVLDLSYINAGALEIERRDFELTYCVESVVETCATRIKDKADAPVVESRLDPALPAWVVGDRSRLRQVLLSVIDRAIERSPQGRVTLAARIADQDASDFALRFEVTDSGEPLDAFARERMFDEYPTHEGGTGMLGLAVARQLARLMGGDMGVEDRGARGGSPARIGGGVRERGTCVWMTVRCGISKREVAGARPDERVDLAGLRVLLVDSDGESRSALRKAGLALGLELDAAATAAEALQVLKDSAAAGKTYAVGLIDADLSDIGGRDFGELLKGVPEAAATGLILLRPVGAVDRPTDLARHGFDAWVSKPISESRLRTALLHVTAEAVEERELAEPAEPRPKALQLGAHVLLVEDNIVNQKVARLLLTQIGCKVEVAMGGMDAIEKAMALEQLDLILMDCLMPELDGYDATRAIRLLSDPIKSRVPIVGMTTGSRASSRDGCIAAGMDDHVTKPVRLEELMRVVRHWSARPSHSIAEKAMYEEEDDKALDPGVIASLRDLGGDDPSIFNELVELFLEDTPARIAALEQALASGSARELEAAAHTLKSSAGNLGAYVLSTLCKELEDCGRNQKLEAATSLVARSREEFKRVEEQLREELA